MAKGLAVAEGLALPLDAVTETFLIFGKRGSGKSTTSTVMTEEMITAGLPVCVLDPMGAWWGLRSSADGRGPGLPVTILGGEHADLPLSSDSGAAVADLLVAERVPIVLDMFALSKTQQRIFVTDFMERLFRINREPLHLVVDEADRFAPQRGSPEGARLLGAYEDIVLRGRKPGIGSTSITLRPAQLHSAIRSQVEVLIAMRLLGKLDVQAIDEWVRLHATEEEARELKASLPSLRVGTAWFWSPGWLEIMQKVQVRPASTFDSRATPKVGEQRIVPRQFARVNPADLERMTGRLASVVEKTAKDDPKALRRRIAELERAAATKAPAADSEVKRLRGEVARLGRALEDALARPVERVEVPAVSPGDIAALDQSVTAMRETADMVEMALRAAQRQAATPPAASRPAPAPRPVPAAQPPPERRAEPGEGMALGKAHRAILTVLAQFPEGRTKQQVAALSGYSVKSSGFANALGALRSAGCVTRGQPVQATPEGVEALGGDWEPLPSGAALVEHWMSKLGKAERTILRVLLDVWPDELARDEVAERSGYSPTSSGFANALGKLRSLQLVNGLTADDTLGQHAQESRALAPGGRDA